MFVHFQGRHVSAAAIWFLIRSKGLPEEAERRLTVEGEEMLVMADLGYVSGRHGVRGGNEATNAGSPHFIRTQSVLLGFIMWRECTGLFCNDTFRNDKQAAFRGANCLTNSVDDKVTGLSQHNTPISVLK